MHAPQFVMKFDDMPVHVHENMLQHHAFHIALTLVALAAIGGWWFYDKKSKNLDNSNNEKHQGSRSRSQRKQK
jgi:hypothetical protein